MFKKYYKYKIYLPLIITAIILLGFALMFGLYYKNSKKIAAVAYDPTNQVTTGDLLPVSDGSWKKWKTYPGTGSRVSTHYTQVDETICNGKTDYNYTNETGPVADRKTGQWIYIADSYFINLDSIPNGSKIISIGITPCVSTNRPNGNDSVMSIFASLNGLPGVFFPTIFKLKGDVPQELETFTIGETVGTETYWTLVYLTGSYDPISFLKNNQSTLEIGVASSSGKDGIRLSQIKVKIKYIPPTY